MTSERDEELRAIAASAQELLRWEDAVGGTGFPAVEVPAMNRVRAPIASEHHVPAADPSIHAERAAVSDDPRARLAILESEAAKCTRCELHRGRHKSVFARGSADTDLAFVGEGPGYHEDQQGYPFVGRAGQLLDRMIAAMGYDRDGVYVCNVVKCRPPENRTPLPTEATACAHFLVPQLEAVAPKVIVALGRCAAENLQCVPATGKWRGTWGQWRGIPVMPTYHPAFLLRSPQFKKPVWEDLQNVLRRLDREVPGR